MNLMEWSLLAVAVFATAAIGQSSRVNEQRKVKCYECNVWKAGYGHLCDNPRVRDDCVVCMKTETTIYMGYYKNRPRTSTIISSICAKSHNLQGRNYCERTKLPDGYRHRCYCSEDRCNSPSAALPSASASLALLALSAALVVSLAH